MVGQERTSLLPNHHLTDLKQEAALKSMETEISMKVQRFAIVPAMAPSFPLANIACAR